MEERHTNPLEAMDPETLRRLERRAAKHARSVEDEAVAILTTAVEPFESANTWFEERLAGTGGFAEDEFSIPPRTGSPARWADFSR
ncbi:plasmid stabilization protein [Glycomyces sp. NPDC046736]|uniref:FitA-like ribbon-helix-helix domain-containing protein n=1 Tax=Glycomyces sp. NPDC046736 TaxID=3155615 RepID=UPI0033F2E5E3